MNTGLVQYSDPRCIYKGKFIPLPSKEMQTNTKYFRSFNYTKCYLKDGHNFQLYLNCRFREEQLKLFWMTSAQMPDHGGGVLTGAEHHLVTRQADVLRPVIGLVEVVPDGAASRLPVDLDRHFRVVVVDELGLDVDYVGADEHCLVVDRHIA